MLAAHAATLLAAAALSPQEKAALVVVSGLPAPSGVGGVIVRRWDTRAPRPPGALVFVDQEGGEARAFRDLAPVLDLRGPLGARHFRRPELGVAFARGLGEAACVKHFPGLGSTPISTDERPHVDGRVRTQDLAPFRADPQRRSVRDDEQRVLRRRALSRIDL